LRIKAELRTEVAQRARFRCEYCLIHEVDTAFAHEVDHVISRQHGGETSADNLAYSCMICNRFKGTNIGSLNAAGSVVRLYSPRSDRWEENFRLRGAVIEPLTGSAEATVKLLRMNAAERVVERSVLQLLGRYPCG
jgi:HNH endonuclease